MSLGKRLKVARKYRELKQLQLANLTGGVVSQATISALEGRDSKKSEFSAVLALALDIRLEWLLDGEDPMLFEDLPPKTAKAGHDAEAAIFNDYFTKLPTESRRFLWIALRLVAETVYTEDPEATVTQQKRRDLEKLVEKGERLNRGRAA